MREDGNCVFLLRVNGGEGCVPTYCVRGIGVYNIYIGVKLFERLLLLSPCNRRTVVSILHFTAAFSKLDDVCAFRIGGVV